MKTIELTTHSPEIRLIEPNVERDAVLSVQWLNGELGYATMLLMGNSERALENILPTTLEKETERVQEFLENTDQLNWQIQYQDQVVGAVWVDLEAKDNTPAPSIHIMIGNPDMRGKGIGLNALSAAIKHLEGLGHAHVYSRHLTTNATIKDLLNANLGFSNIGQSYLEDGLEFQNVIKDLKPNTSS